ncbi:MAG: MoxR family ATPase [Leptolyngbyaceae cyanobacterium MO_188.B28]|nr:MoxR family ATPase [Leptolyngbyaceae cyanobacterium MO_188.B28]
MRFPFYKWDRSGQRSESPTQLPVAQRSRLLKPESYIPDQGLQDACNVALLLGQPLLLTGEPGTGKTQFAYSLAWKLGFEAPLKFETKSDSVARDLFYTYDALKRFQDIQSGLSSSNVLDYITYQALGLAILRAQDTKTVKHLLPSDFPFSGKQRSVVLIDEIDKAPRDFPNDLLNELEQLYFRVPELGNIKVEADLEWQPVVVITSNSEKDLPDAFLRRCIYYNIPFPEPDRLADIIASHLGLHIDSHNVFLQTALDLFYHLRLPEHGLRKKPATAELLGWLITLQRFTQDEKNPLSQPDNVFRTLSCLIKTAGDQTKARGIVEAWMKKQSLYQNG